MSLPLPSSYNTLSLPDILLSHIPSTSPTPTPVILITLHRPRAHNAFTDAMALSLVTALDTLSSDPRVKCIVVTGHGRMDGGGQVALAVHRCRKPVVAAVNGSAVGVGVTMTLPMNIRVCSERAKIGFVFARRGIVMEAASSYFLPRLIGHSAAMHLITTGSVYPSTHPLLSSLFTSIVPESDVLPTALSLAADIAKNTSTVSTALMKDMMWRGPGSAEETHLLDSKILLELFEGRDKLEGVESFLKKREPRFEGRMERDAPQAWPWWAPVDVKAPQPGVKKESKL
ncbi:3-hydroxypropionyl-coenzyme A dehydratase [Lachnellula suecica]|uniref:3-hydroxypropionyl-coenzyme A dehydratase n=1 Tax=Lachnellula suecica TaxID=602035 RepID=A0A8T9BQT9_9HELO|nr:3-hydroxypropionyl-coenzyme A dehydratase [Lachnellula suecica]